MTTVRTVLNLLSHGLSYKKIRLQTGASNGFINKVATAARPDLQAFLKLSDLRRLRKEGAWCRSCGEKSACELKKSASFHGLLRLNASNGTDWYQRTA